MKEFQREERYIVVKIKDVGATRLGALRQFLAAKEIPTRECVVVEPHHPHYEETWENVQRWAEGRPSIGEERDALAAHIERMRDVWQRLHLKSPSPVEVLQAYSYVMRDAPTTSLARLKAQWQAEALEEQAEAYAQKQTLRISMELQDAADEKRRQAEGGE